MFPCIFAERIKDALWVWEDYNAIQISVDSYKQDIVDDPSFSRKYRSGEGKLEHIKLGKVNCRADECILRFRSIVKYDSLRESDL